MASPYVRETAAGKSISAYVVLNKKGVEVATVQAHFSNGGHCLVNVWDDKAGFQHASAGGAGYDKFTRALSGMVIDGHVMSDHCGGEGVPKMPKGRHTYPKDFRVKPGYTLANWVSVSKATGRKIYVGEWVNRAIESLSLKRDSMSESEWGSVMVMSRVLEKEWRASDDCETGWSSCFREAGMDYLKALSYRVIQAI